MNTYHSAIKFLIFFLFPVQLYTQQVVDSSFQFLDFIPAYKNSEGPVVLADLHHNNFFLKEGNYNPFFDLLEKDGYRVHYLEKDFSYDLLHQNCSILVIINALAKENIDNWAFPVYPAFSKEEIESVYKWVINGGSLLLVADHMPFPGAAALLAEKFGAFFSNGFAIDTIQWDPLVFRRFDQTLKDHPVTAGRNNAERIDSVATFWGQAFTIDQNKMQGLFSFSDHVVSFNPDTAWRFREHTPVVPAKNWLQAAAGEFGKGRVIILGEAGMLTAQLVGPNRVKTGMNSLIGKQNPQFILNALHWLSFLFPDEKHHD